MVIKYLLNHVRRRAAWHYDNFTNRAWLHRASTVQAAEEHQEAQVFYGIPALFYLGSAWLLLMFYPHLLPFGFWRVWDSSGSIGEWLWAAKWIFAWGAGITLFFSLISKNDPEENRHAEELWFKHLGLSLFAGVFEELSFRWAHFLFFAIAVQWGDFILGGFYYGSGLVHYVQVNFMGPVADWATLGYLHDWLPVGATWFVGAGLLTANSHFRDGHKYLGPMGYVNSWFIGMAMFYFTLTYGLLSAIIVHALYDAIIFTIRYIDEVVERAGGNA